MYVQYTETVTSLKARFIFMRVEFAPITQVWIHFFKCFNRKKSTQDEKVGFIKENELKLSQVELLSFFDFKSVFVFN